MDIQPFILKLREDFFCLATAEENIEKQLELFCVLTARLWHDYSGTYAHAKLEQHLGSLSEHLITVEPAQAYDSNHILHVMTEAYSVGGHTRVVDNWICGDSGKKHSIFFNNPDSEIPYFLKDAVALRQGHIILNNKKTFVEKAQYLCQKASQYRYIVLHHHPEDILPLLAFGTSRFKRPIFLYHHADHVWNCGYSIADYVLELSMHGIQFSHQYRGIPLDKSKFQGIPVQMEFCPPANEKKPDAEIRLACMASAHKFQPIPNFNFQKVMIEILQIHPNVIFELIGPTGDELFWNEIKKDYARRVYFHGNLPKSKAHDILKTAHLYIDSFPIGSGTSLLEAVSLGLPALSLRTPMQNMDGYTHLTCETTGELIDKISELIRASASEISLIVKNNFRVINEWYGLNIFIERINELDNYLIRSPIGPLKQITIEGTKHDHSEFLFHALKQSCLKGDYAQYSETGDKNYQGVIEFRKLYDFFVKLKADNDPYSTLNKRLLETSEVVSIKQVLNERDKYINDLLTSNSWRITKPLRFLPRVVRDFKRVIALKKNKFHEALQLLILRQLLKLKPNLIKKIVHNMKFSFFSLISIPDYCESKNPEKVSLAPSEKTLLRMPTVYPECDQKMYSESWTLETPSVFAIELSNVEIIGGSDFIFIKDQCLHHGLYQFKRDCTVEERNGLLVSINVHNHNILFNKCHSKEDEKIKGAAINATGGLTTNYAHWLTETAPKLAMIEEIKKYSGLPLIINYDLHPNILDSIYYLTDRKRELIQIKKNQILSVDQLISITPTAYIPYEFRRNDAETLEKLNPNLAMFSPYGLHCLRKKLIARCTAESFNYITHQYIYIKRNSSARHIKNDKEVEAIMLKLGFEIIEPESLTFLEQVQLFSRAKIIVGQSGAALANIIFAPKNCSIIVMALQSPYRIHYYFSNIASIMDLKCYLILCPPSPSQKEGAYSFHSNFIVDISILERVIKKVSFQ